MRMPRSQLRRDRPESAEAYESPTRTETPSERSESSFVSTGSAEADEHSGERPEISSVRTQGPGVHGPHYVLVPASHPVASSGITLVTGEVPSDYERVTVECEGGEIVEATILDTRHMGNVKLFVAPVSHCVWRIVASKDGGVHGIFLNVSLLESTGPKTLVQRRPPNRSRWIA